MVLVKGLVKTKKTPKPLIKVGKLSLLEHVLRQVESADIKHIYISVHYLAHMIEDYIKETGRCASVSLLHEKSPMGTAGSISMVQEHIDGNLIVANCDLISELDINSLIRFHSGSTADAIAAVVHKFEIPFGVIRHNSLGLFEKRKTDRFEPRCRWYLYVLRKIPKI